MHAFGRDRGSIVIGWLVKVIVVLVVVCLIAFDAIAEVAGRLNASDDANNAASAAAASWQQEHNAQAAFQAAADSLTNDSEKILTKGFIIDPDGTVHLVLKREVTTVLMARIGPLKKYTTVTEDGSAGPPTQ
jgi:flagellar biosynthesis/type III secretory pathway M-ring protein FliF/YscJ